MGMNNDSLKTNPIFDHRHFNENQNHISSERPARRGSYSEASSAYSGSDTMQVSSDAFSSFHSSISSFTFYANSLYIYRGHDFLFY